MYINLLKYFTAAYDVVKTYSADKITFQPVAATDSLPDDFPKVDFVITFTKKPFDSKDRHMVKMNIMNPDTSVSRLFEGVFASVILAIEISDRVLYGSEKLDDIMSELSTNLKPYKGNLSQMMVNDPIYEKSRDRARVHLSMRTMKRPPDTSLLS